jgi:hypothetical protein
MATDYAAKWVRGGTPFSFASPYEIARVEADKAEYSIPTATAALTDGEYQNNAYLTGRVIQFGGFLIGSSSQDLRDKWDTLSAAIAGRAEGKFYKHSDRYVSGRVVNLSREEDEGLNYLRWSVAIRCSDPYYYDDTTNLQILSSGANAVTVGGGYPAAPALTFAVSSAGTPGSYFQVTADSGQYFRVAPATIGTAVVDCRQGLVYRYYTGTPTVSYDATNDFSGSFLEQGLPASGASLTLSNIGTPGVILTQTRLTWQKRYLGG